MGMSASQARYLNLVAQQSDLEFQGQQINESRTTLSEQTNNLYSQLQNLAVPTPPHTSEYTTIQYSGSLGADNFTLGTIIPSGSTYTVNLEYEKAGNSTFSAGKAELKTTPKTILVNEVTGTFNVSAGAISTYFVDDGSGNYRKATEADFVKNEETGSYTSKEGLKYYKQNENGSMEIPNPDYVAGSANSLAGYPLMDCETGLDTYMTPEQKESAIMALRNGFPQYDELSDAELLDMFYVSFSTEGSLKVPHFVLKTDVDGQLPQGSQSRWAEFYDITSTSTYTKTATYENCQLTFDTSGRITEIAIPIEGDNGEIVYHKVALKATSVTDEQAYEDAYNQYEYSKYEYDKEQLKINAQMSIIQEEDKKLELKLQRLDNERTQITTEIEALDKVINDNIEKSYKTFSG